MENKMKRRFAFEYITNKSKSPLGRIIVITGARQTGKTTIARQCFPGYAYISLEDPVQKGDYLTLTASQWKTLYPYAVLDEVQKTPVLIESIKSVYDQHSEPRYVLLGSSQFLLLKKVKESLAGRCVIVEIFPLTLPELLTESFDDEITSSFFVQYIRKDLDTINLYPSFSLEPAYAVKQKVYDFYLKYGAYPALTNELLTDEEKYEWLTNYVRTFLERDIRDLASFRDMEPFVKLQRYLANVTGNILNYSSIAKETGVSVPTVKRYVQYMELSYQAFVLPAWFSNPLKKLVKSPKVHFSDTGILRTVLQKKGTLNGNEYESTIVSEIYKQIQVNRLPLTCSYLRTLDGKEVDLLLEAEDYFIAIEIKATENVGKTDVRNLAGLQEILNKPLKHSFVLSNDRKVKQYSENITAVHAAAFLC
jgi:predicted AAA+ superfamily ATPase